MTMYAWKFLIRDGQYTPLHPDDQPKAAVTEQTSPIIDVAGCIAVAVAPDQQAAYEKLVATAKSEGWDYRWLRVATVQRMDIDTTCFICWSA